MNRDELASALASRLDVPVHSVRVFLHAYFDAVKTTLRSGETVDLGGLGFWVPVRGDSGALAVVRYSQPLPAAVFAGGRLGDPRFVIPLEELRTSELSDRVVVDIAGILSEIAAPVAVDGVALLRLDSETEPEVTGIDTAHSETDVEEEFDESEDGYYEADRYDEDSMPPVSMADDYDETDSLVQSSSLAALENPDDDIPEVILPAMEDMPLSTENDVPVDTMELPRDEAESLAPPASADIAYPRQELPVEYDRTVQVPDIDAAKEHEHEDFSDDDSFNRNRDQLFNPPEKKSNRPLLLVAMLLTAVVVAIILYLTYADQPERELPGVDVPTGLLLLTQAQRTV